jgi:VirE N-terminal domain
VRKVRQVLAAEGARAYRKAKGDLPAFTFGGTFRPKRGINYLQHHSGILHGDMDHVKDLDGTRRAVCADPRTAYLFTSPSADGLKCGVHGPVVTDDAAYKHAWQVISEEYAQRYGVRWDVSGKDCSRLCFVSWDPDAYWNAHAERFEVPPPPPLEPPTARIVSRTPEPSNGGGYDFVGSALRTATQMIQAAELGVRHHARLRAARLLGGFVGAGLLSEHEALSVLASALIGHTEDLKAALKTVKAGLRYGAVNAFSLETLEAERQAWLEESFTVHPVRPHHAFDHDPWAGRRTLPLRPYGGLRLPREVRRG